MPTTARLTNKRSRTRHWEASPWSVTVESGTGRKTLPQRKPFALIGSHECCHLRVNSRRVPEVAYLICCFETKFTPGNSPALNRTPGQIYLRIIHYKSDLAASLSLWSTPKSTNPLTLSRASRFRSKFMGNPESVEKQLNERVCLLSETSDDLEPSPLHPATHAAINEDRAPLDHRPGSAKNATLRTLPSPNGDPQ